MTVCNKTQHTLLTVCLSERFCAVVSRFYRLCLMGGLLLLTFVSGQLSADQNHPDLDSLFMELQKAQTNNDARRLEAEIWQRWFDAPDDAAGDLLSQISAAMSVGRYQIALQLCNQLVDTNPEFAEAWNKRATVHYLMGNHGQSIADINQTLRLEPRHFGALSGLGLIFMASENFEAAADAFAAVLALSPGSDNARGSVARAKSMIGEDI